MPNPKTGTVTMDVAETVKQLKAGRIEFKVDRYGNIHALVGKVSFTFEQIVENIKTVIDQIVRLKPASAKGNYIQNITISSTMGPGIKLDKVVIVEGVR